MPGIQELRIFQLFANRPVNRMGVESESYRAVDGVDGLFFKIC